MRIKIALIVAENSYSNIMPILPEFQDRCDIKVFQYKQIAEASDIYLSCRDSFDGFMFSGWLPYSVVTGSCGTIKKPHSFFSLSEGDFFRTMFLLAVQHPGIDYRRVMVDDPQLGLDFSELFPQGRQCTLTSFYPLEFAMHSISSRTAQAGDDSALIYSMALDAYRTAWREKNIDIVVTRLANLKPILDKEGIENYILAPSHATMKGNLDRLINLINSGSYVDMLSVYGMLDLCGNATQEDRESLYSAISVFKRQSGMKLFITQEDKGIHITTSHHTFRELTDKMKSCSLSSFLNKNSPCQFVLGWGIGYDILQARQNAVKALKLARHGGMGSTFAVDENGMVAGPLQNHINLSYSADTTETVVSLSNRYDISRMYVKQLLALIDKRKNNVFTSEELAEALGISPRSSRRILAKLNETGGAIRLEDNNTGLRGRPSLRYCISLN